RRDAVEALEQFGARGIRDRRVVLDARTLLADEERDHLELDAVRRAELSALGLGLDLAHLAREERDDGGLVVAARGRGRAASGRRLGGGRGRHAPPEPVCRGGRLTSP